MSDYWRTYWYWVAVTTLVGIADMWTVSRSTHPLLGLLLTVLMLFCVAATNWACDDAEWNDALHAPPTTEDRSDEQ